MRGDLQTGAKGTFHDVDTTLNTNTEHEHTMYVTATWYNIVLVTDEPRAASVPSLLHFHLLQARRLLPGRHWRGLEGLVGLVDHGRRRLELRPQPRE